MTSTINVLSIGDTFYATEWQWYGIVQVRIGANTYDVAAVIGVPVSHQQEAQASGGRIEQYVRAWYLVAADWAEAKCDDGTEGVPQQLVADVEAAIAEEAVRLWDEAHAG